MPNKNYIRGRSFEYAVKKDLEAQGYHVLRTSGSHGAYDLIAIRDTIHMFIQCKVTKKNNLKQLLQEFKKTSPVKTWTITPDFEIRPVLTVKRMGESSYSTYSIYGEKIVHV